jgi:hypothetical protein
MIISFLAVYTPTSFGKVVILFIIVLTEVLLLLLEVVVEMLSLTGLLLIVDVDCFW